MAVRIRLTRKGAKKAPFYRIVVADSRYPRDGRFIDIIGHYNPVTEPAQLRIDKEKALYWINNGAKPSDTVRALLKREGVLDLERPSKKQSEEAEKETQSLSEASM